MFFVDGYNLLKYAYPHNDATFSRQRDLLVDELAYYKSKKNIAITVVFDGGLASRAERTIHRGVIVIFSGQKQSADEWIIEHVAQGRGSERLVVTRDRRLADACRASGADVVDTHDFYRILQDVILDDASRVLSQGSYRGQGEAIKFEGSGENEVLDLLMEHVDVSSYDKIEHKKQFKKRVSRAESKEEKQYKKKLERIGKK
jgi:predicted RNA-binding protein with PIN domain